jgi:hypothetical protein
VKSPLIALAGAGLQSELIGTTTPVGRIGSHAGGAFAESSTAAPDSVARKKRV